MLSKVHKNRIINASNSQDLPEKNIKNGCHGVKCSVKFNWKNLFELAETTKFICFEKFSVWTFHTNMNNVWNHEKFSPYCHCLFNILYSIPKLLPISPSISSLSPTITDSLRSIWISFSASKIIPSFGSCNCSSHQVCEGRRKFS